MVEGTNYKAILKDLLEERANLDLIIAWVQAKLGRDETSVQPPFTGLPPLKAVSLKFPHVRQDQFFKMSVPEAIRACLNLAKRPQSAREITDALQAGGLSHRAKDLYQ